MVVFGIALNKDVADTDDKYLYTADYEFYVVARHHWLLSGIALNKDVTDTFTLYIINFML